VRVGHCQASKLKIPVAFAAGIFLWGLKWKNTTE